ncbi:unnamed protein product [Trichobilharzia szidati]|nr:unnamed protein product [Trichobilharzia szidati]
MNDVEKYVAEALSYISPMYRKLFVLHMLFGSSDSVSYAVYSELRKKFFGESTTLNEVHSKLHMPWNLSSKIQAFVEKPDKKISKKNEMTSNELKSTTSLFRVDPKFLRFTLVPVPVCPIQMKNHLPNESLTEKQELASRGLEISNTGACNHNSVEHPNELHEWDSLIQKSWESVSSKIRQAYSKIKIRYVLMRERNIYCGPFSIYVLLERHPNSPLCKRRVIHADNKNPWLAHCEGSAQQRTIKFLDISIKSFREDQSTKSTTKCNNNNQYIGTSDFMAHLNRVWLTGHAGSVRTLWLDTHLQLLLSGSYDTSIRLWNLSETSYQQQQPGVNANMPMKNPVSFRNSRSKCIRIFRGHTDTVLCIWLDKSKLWPKTNLLTTKSRRPHTCYNSIKYNDESKNADKSFKKDEIQGTYQFASGSVDCTCCVWRLDERKPIWTMKHASAVTAVGLRGFICTTGERNGRVNVWRIGINKPTLLKTLNDHTECITALRFDSYHLVTSSKDKSVKIWSIIGEFTDCLGTLIHTGEVLCVELIDLRIITGCSDGRIRVWNLLTQHCQRILPGNYRHDPIISLMPLENRLIVNTQHNILAFNFDPVNWEYHESARDKAEEYWLKGIMTSNANNRNNNNNNNNNEVIRSSSQHDSHSSQTKLTYAESRYFRSRLIGSADPRFFRQPTGVPMKDKSASRRSLSAQSKLSKTSSVVSQSSEKSNSISPRFSRDKAKSRQFEFLISPPIPGTYAAKHRVEKRPKSALAVTKALKQMDHEKVTTEQQSKVARKSFSNLNLFNKTNKEKLLSSSSMNDGSNEQKRKDNKLIHHKILSTTQYYFQSSQEIKQFKLNLLKQIHNLKRNQLNTSKTDQNFLKDTYTKLNLNHESLLAKCNRTRGDRVFDSSPFGVSDNDNSADGDKHLEQLFDLLEYDFEQAHRNSQSIKRLRPKSAPEVSMGLMPANEARSIFSQSNVRLEDFSDKDKQTIDLNSIQLPKPLIAVMAPQKKHLLLL